MADNTKRDYTRVNNEFNVRIVVENKKNRKAATEINTSKSINISATGLLITCNEKLDVGTILHITFMRPNSYDFFKGSGKVVRVEEESDGSYKTGIHFMDLSPQDVKTLDYYLHLGK
jgi:c-di-GMP-binding flagellar brake protein YcgR